MCLDDQNFMWIFYVKFQKKNQKLTALTILTEQGNKYQNAIMADYFTKIALYFCWSCYTDLFNMSQGIFQMIFFPRATMSQMWQQCYDMCHFW